MAARLLISLLALAAFASSPARASYLLEQISAPASQQQQAPSITPFAFNETVQENQRVSVLCTISSGDLPVNISWLKDGQLLTPTLAASKRIIIKPDSDQSLLKLNSVRLDQAGNYSCQARNRAGWTSHTAQLVVQAEPRWLRDPRHEPIVASRGQPIVIDCQSTGWPRPTLTWSIKRHTQANFEPVEQSARLTLAANGSLVIRSADKSDEANYLCRADNKVGRPISWSTSLKINVPAHFEANKQQVRVERKLSQVQLRCDAQGDEPLTIEWYKNKQRLLLSGSSLASGADQQLLEANTRYSIHNKPLQSGLISQLLIKQAQRQDNALFECVTRNLVGKDRLQIELLVQEEPENIAEIQASQVSSRSAELVWSEPYDGRSPITSYMLQFKQAPVETSGAATGPPGLGSLSASISDQVQLQQQQQQQQQQQELELLPGETAAILDSKTASEDSDWQQARRILVPVQALNSTLSLAPAPQRYTIRDLEPSSRYVLRALAANAIGQSKFSQPMEFTTHEEAPQVAPGNVHCLAINSTSVRVSWDEIPRSKHLGRIHGYYIGYRLANSSGQNFVKKPYVLMDNTGQQQQQLQDSSGLGVVAQRLETVIGDMRRNTGYEFTVFAFNLPGVGPASEPVVCKTNEMEAPRPVKLAIRRESNESIFIEWQRDPLDLNPIDDYLLYQEKNSASQEWLQVRLPGNQSQYKAPGLKCGTRYQFYIIAQNKLGKSEPSGTVSASTSGALPAIPSKTSLIKMVNSTCLLVNLNAFQDNGCRIKNFNVRYRVEKSSIQQAGASTLSGANGLAASHQALTSSLPKSSMATAGSSSASLGPSASAQTQHQQSSTGAVLANSGEWITIRPKSNAKYQRGSDDDRMEYLCDLSPVGEYTIHVAAANDVGRSEIEYTVLMSSDELRYSAFRELFEAVSALPKVFAYIPSIIVISLAALLLVLVSMIMYTASIEYYQKFVILQNQIRASRRAKAEEKRRRKLNGGSRGSQKIDLWADEYDDEGDDEDAGEDDDNDHDDNDNDGLCLDDAADESSGSSSGIGIGVAPSHLLHQHQHHQQQQQQQLRHQRQLSHPLVRGPPFHTNSGHYVSNLATNNASFQQDSSSIDSRCMKYKYNNNDSCHSSASTDSIHGRFQCLNAKHYVKMNEYTMLPATAASGMSPPTATVASNTNSSDIYGAVGQQQQVDANQSPYGYYTGLRRPRMQTYLPAGANQSPYQSVASANLQQQQQQQRRSQNHDIYGYYMAPKAANSPAQQAANEAANSIFVPPRQIIYSAPNIRRPPQVFL